MPILNVHIDDEGDIYAYGIDDVRQVDGKDASLFVAITDNEYEELCETKLRDINQRIADIIYRNQDNI